MSLLIKRAKQRYVYGFRLLGDWIRISILEGFTNPFLLGFDAWQVDSLTIGFVPLHQVYFGNF